MLVFEFDGIEFELDAMRPDGIAVAEAVTLPRGVTLDEQLLAVPELLSEEALDFAFAAPELEAGGTSGGGFRVGCRNTQQAIEAADAVGDSSFAELSALLGPRPVAFDENDEGMKAAARNGSYATMKRPGWTDLLCWPREA